MTGHQVGPNGEPAIGRYQIVQTVAIHDQSTVFKALDPDLERFVSLKLYHAHAVTGAESVQEVIAEARALVRIDSSYVAKCHNVETIQGTPILINEWIEGESLNEYLESHALTFGQVKSLFVQIATGVLAIHEQGLLHRDIKPSNIIIDTAGRPRIIDLGLVRSDAAAAEDFAGTPSYVSPEVASGDPRVPGRATDIFGLGAVLYFMLTGRPPFAGATKSEVLRNARECVLVPSHEVAGASPNQLDRVCARCLLQNPEARFQSVSELLARLRGSRVPMAMSVVLGLAGLAWGVQAMVSGIAAKAAGNEDGTELSAAAEEMDEKATLDVAVDEALAGKFEDAIRLAREGIAEAPNTDQPNVEARRGMTIIADCAMQTGRLDLLAAVCEERVALEASLDPESLWSHEALIEQRHAARLALLSPAELKEFSAAKKLVFEAGSFIQRQNFETARAKCDAAWPNLVRILGSDHLQTVRCLSQYATSLLGVDARSQALAVFNEVGEGLKRVFGAESLDQLQLWKRRFEVLLVVAGRPDLALLDCQRALSTAMRAYPPNSIPILQLRIRVGECLLVDRQFGAAREHVDAFLATMVELGMAGSVGEMWALMLRARVGIESGQHVGVQADMDRIAELLLRNASLVRSAFVGKVARLRGKWCASQGDSKGAAEHVRVWIDVMQENPGAAEGLVFARSLEALHLARCQQHRKASALAMETQRRSNLIESVQDSEVYCNLAEVQYRAGRPERAREALQRAVESLRYESLVQCWDVRKQLDELATVDEVAAEMAADAKQRIHQRILAAGDSLPSSIADRVRASFQ